MEILISLGIGIAFTAFAALVFSVLTLILGKVFPSFEVSGPDEFQFTAFYLRYLIIAAVYTFISLPLGSGCLGQFLGIAALAIAYKFVFDAGWIQAFVIGTIGGIIALVLFVILMLLILIPTGLMEQAAGP